MKLKNGQSIDLQTRKIMLPRGIELTVCALPYGWALSFSEMWPEPIPPVKVIRGVGGREEVQHKHNDPGYNAEKLQREFGLVCYRIYRALERDTNIEWDTEAVITKADILDLINEFRNGAFSTEEMMLIAQASSVLAGDHIDDDGRDKDIKELFV